MDFFKYCTLDNPVFFYSIFWMGLFVVTGGFVIYHKMQEKQEAADSAKAAAASLVETPAAKPAAKKAVTKAATKKSEAQKAELIARNEKKRELVR